MKALAPLARTSILLLLAAALAPHAAAYEESDAPTLEAQVVRVWHDPEVPDTGTQWNGYIRFVADHNVTSVLYQICNVGDACFAPPTPATRLNETTWTYDTDDYRDPTFDKPVLWGDAAYSGGAPWRVGTQFTLTYSVGTQVALPHGEDLAGDACKGRYQECAESHYFAWDLPAGSLAPTNGAPGVGALPVLAVLALAAVAYPLRNRQDRR